MTVNKTALSCYDEITGENYDVAGYVINLMLKDFFPITITGVESKNEIKKYLLQTVNSLFDQEWEKYINSRENKYIHQFGEIS